MNTWRPWKHRLRAGLGVALAMLAATLLLPAIPAAAAAPRPVITAPTPERAARFGGAVAADGDLMVIGSRYADEQGVDSGAAYVFARNQGGADRWELVKTLRPETGASGEQFGAAVDISRDVIIVGAPGNSEIGATSGAAYVFERHHGGPNNWGQTKQLFGSRADPQDSFGLAVAVSGDAIAVGAPLDDSLGQNSGLVYLFTRYAGADNRWAEVQVIEPLPDDRTDSMDAFGSALAMDGQLLVVGVPFGDYLNQPARGAVYFYERHAGLANRWQRTRVRISGDGGPEERFGFSVAIDGGRVLVGAPSNTTNGSTRGAAFVFEQNAGGANMWQQTQKLTANGGAAGDGFGHAVALDGRRMLVGAPHHDDGNQSGVGAIYLFADGQELSRLRASDRRAGDSFGAAVALSEGLIIAGAPERHSAGLSDSGAAYLFSSASDAWGETAAIFRSAGDFGRSLALDGYTMAAHQHADSQTNRRASVTLFQREHTGGWRQMITLVSSPNSEIGNVAALDGDTLMLRVSNELVVRERNQGGPDRWGSVRTINIGGGAFFDLDGDTLVVAQNSGLGERFEDGSVRVFERNRGGINRWGLAATLTFGDTGLPQPERGDGFGSAIALDGNTMVIAAQGNFDQNDDNHVFVFERNTDGRSWRFDRELSAGATPDNFGLSVDIDADTIVIGSVPIENSSLGGSSEVRLYSRHEGGTNLWGEIKRLPAPAQNDLFGLHVALDNDRLLVAAPFANVRGERSGAGYLYERNAGGADNWGRVQTLTGSSTVAGNFLGEEAQLDGGVAVLSSYVAGDVYLFENAVRVPPGLELELAAHTAEPGREVTLRARLDAAATDADLPPPQGEVRFVVNGEPAGSAPLAADGTATLTLPGLPTGVHTLTATFSGGAIWGDCEAPPVSLFVGVEPPAAAPEDSHLFLPTVQR